MVQMLIHVLLKCLFLGPIFSVAHLLFGFFREWISPPIPSRVTCIQDCVGLATAAFGLEVLEGKVKPGVWFPVEPQAENKRCDFGIWGLGWGLDLITTLRGGKSWIWFLGTHMTLVLNAKGLLLEDSNPEIEEISRFQGIQACNTQVGRFFTDCISEKRRKTTSPFFVGKKRQLSLLLGLLEKRIRYSTIHGGWFWGFGMCRISMAPPPGIYAPYKVMKKNTGQITVYGWGICIYIDMYLYIYNTIFTYECKYPIR